MKFRIQKSALVRAARACAGVASKSSSPIYESLLIRAMPGQPLSFSATDLETSITLSAAATVEESGMVALPASDLAALAAKLPEGEIVVTVPRDTTDGIVTAGRGRYKISGHRAEDFPEIPQPPKIGAIELPGPAVAEAIGRVAHAISKERQRYALNGAMVKVVGRKVEFVATDGRRLALATIDLPNVPDCLEWSAIIGSAALRQIAGIAAGAETVRLSSERNHAYAEVDGHTIATRQIDGSFPNYRDVIPKGQKSWLIVNRAAILAALDRSSLVDARDANAVRLEAEGGTLTLTAASPEKDTREEIECETDGEPIRVAFQGDFLADAIKAGVGDTVRLAFNGATWPMRIEEQSIQIVMPVTLDEAAK